LQYRKFFGNHYYRFSLQFVYVLNIFANTSLFAVCLEEGKKYRNDFDFNPIFHANLVKAFSYLLLCFARLAGTGTQKNRILKKKEK